MVAMFGDFEKVAISRILGVFGAVILTEQL